MDEPEGLSEVESEPDEAADKPKLAKQKSTRAAKGSRHITKKFIPVPESFND